MAAGRNLTPGPGDPDTRMLRLSLDQVVNELRRLGHDFMVYVHLYDSPAAH